MTDTSWFLSHYIFNASLFEVMHTNGNYVFIFLFHFVIKAKSSWYAVEFIIQLGIDTTDEIASLLLNKGGRGPDCGDIAPALDKCT